MLIQFSMRNFKTFKEKIVLNMVASNYDKSTREQENVFKQDDFQLRLLKSSVIFGANASGKSNVIKALEFFCEAISDLPVPNQGFLNWRSLFYIKMIRKKQNLFFRLSL